MLRVTPAATQAILDSAAQGGMTGMALRVAARLDEDGDIAFGLGFDEQREGDERLSMHGLDVLVGAPSRKWLENVVLDVTQSAQGQPSYVFLPAQDVEPQGCSSKPPSARGGCGSSGCGSCGG